jgi:hypothetical protein
MRLSSWLKISHLNQASRSATAPLLAGSATAGAHLNADGRKPLSDIPIAR